MGDVTVISSSIVQPGNINQSGRGKIHLTPSDLNLMYYDYTQRGLLFPKPDPENENHFISQLKSSLSAALDIYFPLAARLVKVTHQEDNTVSFYIDCEGFGARFVHAIAESISVSDLLQPDGSVPEFLRCFFPMNGVKSIDGLSEPLLALQVTEMKDGVFISFGYNHMVADGASIWNFVHTWSNICSNGSGSGSGSDLALRGWFLNGIDYPIHIPASEVEMPPSCTNSHDVPAMKETVFHFTRKHISNLKAKANEDISSISSLQAVSAHLWRSIIRNSGLNRDDESHCMVSADMRQRVNPPLHKECFGNVAHLGIATTTVGDLLDHGLGWAALQISKVVSSLTNEEYRSCAENWVRDVKIPKPGVGSIVVKNFVAVTSSPWFQVYDNDFGWGKPIAARAGSSHFDGMVVLFRGAEEGSIDVHATLSSDKLLKLLTDVEFLDA